MSADKQLGTKLDPVDHILRSDETLMPSSGFLAAVMERVHDGAAAPAPIPFPWRRALPGIVLALAVLLWGAYECFRTVFRDARQFSFTLPEFSMDTWSTFAPAGWVVLALGVALLSWIFASRMVRGSGLF